MRWLSHRQRCVITSYSIHYTKLYEAWGKEGVEARLASLAAEAEDAVLQGYNILIVSDRNVNKDNVAIPALLATSAIHQHLVTKGLRTRTGLIVETGSARENHHFAVLAGYGAEARNNFV